MKIIVIVLLLIVLIGIWCASTRQKLMLLDENINHAMNQIGVQVSARVEVLMTLLDLTKNYAGKESLTSINSFKARRSMIDAQSSPDDVKKLETVISDMLAYISGVSEQYPEMKSDQNYVKGMAAVESYGKMVRTGILIYNDSVTRLNRTIRVVPTKLIAGLLGFRKKEILTL